MSSEPWTITGGRAVGDDIRGDCLYHPAGGGNVRPTVLKSMVFRRVSRATTCWEDRVRAGRKNSRMPSEGPLGRSFDLREHAPEKAFFEAHGMPQAIWRYVKRRMSE